MRMRKNLRDFGNDFYNTSKRPETVKEAKEFEISLTENKLEFIEIKLNEFEENYHKRQFETFQKLKDDIIDKYEAFLKK
jgi:hypothetical protein